MHPHWRADRMAAEFAWASPLGVAVALFLIIGAFHVIIGVLTPIGTREGREWGPLSVIYTPEADAGIFGRPASEVRANEDVMKLRQIMLPMVSGLLVGVGVLEVSLAWYGLRSGQTWALVALAIAILGMIVLWLPGHRLWAAAGFPGGFASLQPFEWVPAVLGVPAVVLAAWGLR